MSKGTKIKETKKRLIEYSNVAKKIRKAENLDMSINEILLQIIYDTKECREFNTFKEWKKRGFTIIKGSKAYLVWGQPLNKQKTEQETENGNDEFQYFPICYLFSDKQVYKKEVFISENEKTEKTPELEPEYLPL